jgi:hypothetical protein
LRSLLVTIMFDHLLETMARARRWGAATKIIDNTDHHVSDAGIEGRLYSEVASVMGLSVDDGASPALWRRHGGHRQHRPPRLRRRQRGQVL